MNEPAVTVRFDVDGNVRLSIMNVVRGKSMNRISPEVAAEVCVRLSRVLPASLLQEAALNTQGDV